MLKVLIKLKTYNDTNHIGMSGLPLYLNTLSLPGFLAQY